MNEEQKIYVCSKCLIPNEWFNFSIPYTCCSAYHIQFFDMIYLAIDFILINNELIVYIRHQIVFQVSWLRHRNPIPQVLGMNNQIYVKDPRFSVFHNSADPKSKEVGRNKIIRLLIHKFYM